METMIEEMRPARGDACPTMTLPAGVSTFRLATVCPQPEDGTSLMRGIGPLAAMAKADRRLQLDLCQVNPDGSLAYTWDWLVRSDALFLQRPFLPMDVGCAQTARAFGRPVWVDWDDDLSCLPESNPYRANYEPEKMKQLMARLWALADVVTVTTGHLRERLLEHGLPPGTPAAIRQQMNGGKVRVLPNACHWETLLAREAPRTRRVVWRGGRSHDDDLMAFLPAIAEVARRPQFSRWEWWFMGEMSHYVGSQVKAQMPAANLKMDFKDSVHQFMGALAVLAPWLVMVPLGDTRFNRSKSNLAWLEATAAGALTLAPAWPEWDRPGVWSYDGVADFGRQLRGALENFKEGVAPARVAESSRFVRAGLLVPQVNAQRWEILRELAVK